MTVVIYAKASSTPSAEPRYQPGVSTLVNVGDSSDYRYSAGLQFMGGEQNWLPNTSYSVADRRANNAPISVSDLVISGIDNTVVRSLARKFDTSYIGALSYVASGTGFTPGSYYCLGVWSPAPTVALAGAGSGNLSNGTYTYLVTFTTADGDTAPGFPSSGVVVANHTTNGQASVTAIPVGDSYVTGRKVYRTKANGGTYFLLATIADNTTTTFSDNVADASLVTNLPGSNIGYSITLTNARDGSPTACGIAGSTGGTGNLNKITGSVYYEVTASVGLSGALGGPTGTGTGIVDGGVTWKSIGLTTDGGVFIPSPAPLFAGTNVDSARSFILASGTGVGGLGRAMRNYYPSQATQEGPGWVAYKMGQPALGKTHYRRMTMKITSTSWLSSTIFAIKFFRSPMVGFGGASAPQWSTHDTSPWAGPYARSLGTGWQYYEKSYLDSTAAYPTGHDQATQAIQSVGFMFSDLVNDGLWHRFVFVYRPHSAAGVYDGQNEMWLDGVMILSNSPGNIGVTPVGGTKQYTSTNNAQCGGSAIFGVQADPQYSQEWGGTLSTINDPDITIDYNIGDGDPTNANSYCWWTD